jgi:hypothetical protein
LLHLLLVSVMLFVGLLLLFLILWRLLHCISSIVLQVRRCDGQ